MTDSKATMDAEKAIRLLRSRRLPPAITCRAEEEIRREGEAAVARWLFQVPAAPAVEPPRTGRRRASIAHEIVEQERADASDVGRIAYMSRAIIIATLPHSRPNALEFKRTSGGYNLLMHVPAELARQTGVHLPYGVIPRLVFLWLTTQARRTRERVMHLGPTRSAFMRELLLSPRSGKRGNLKTFEQQFKSLLATTFSAWRACGEGASKGGLQLHHRHIASDASLWWEHDQGSLEATIRLDEAFYKEMLQGGIPVDLKAVERIKDNSLAIDIYVWLTYRFSTLRDPRLIAWEYVLDQFSTAHSAASARAFKAYFKKQLKLVLEVYPDANVTPIRSGLQLYPSPPHIRRIRQ